MGRVAAKTGAAQQGGCVSVHANMCALLQGSTGAGMSRVEMFGVGLGSTRQQASCQPLPSSEGPSGKPLPLPLPLPPLPPSSRLLSLAAAPVVTADIGLAGGGAGDCSDGLPGPPSPPLLAVGFPPGSPLACGEQPGSPLAGCLGRGCKPR